MLNEQEKTLVRMVVGAFNESIEEQFRDGEAEKTASYLACGREMMQLPERSGMALMWAGFYAGFGKGIEFATEQEE